MITLDANSLFFGLIIGTVIGLVIVFILLRY